MNERDNGGYSLIEFIIIITVMLIITLGVGIAFVNWRSWNINDCAKKLNTAMSAAKVEGTSKRNSSGLTIKRNSDDIYVLEENGEETEHLGDEKIKIYYDDSSGATDVEITESDSLSISYDRATGSFKPIRTENIGGTEHKIYCKRIVIKRGDKERVITLEQKTGKHYLED